LLILRFQNSGTKTLYPGVFCKPPDLKSKHFDQRIKLLHAKVDMLLGEPQDKLPPVDHVAILINELFIYILERLHYSSCYCCELAELHCD